MQYVCRAEIDKPTESFLLHFRGHNAGSVNCHGDNAGYGQQSCRLYGGR